MRLCKNGEHSYWYHKRYIYIYILVNVIERKKENILLRVTINNLITYNAATLWKYQHEWINFNENQRYFWVHAVPPAMALDRSVV